MQTASGTRQTVLGERKFALEDQLVFARFSGDWNPIHVDPLYARRCLTGQAVVHGIHMLLWALECWAGQNGKSVDLTRLKVQFVRPAFLDEHLVCRLIDAGGPDVVVELVGSAGQAVAIEFAVGPAYLPRCTTPVDVAVYVPTAPFVLGAQDIENRASTWEIKAGEGLAGRHFPACVAVWGEALPVMLAQTSRLVGMECPGLHSLFSELELSTRDAGMAVSLPCFDYQVTQVDRRFGLVSIKVAGAGFTGTVRAFLRPPPARQADMASMSNAVPSHAFSNQRALVIGGSRGLGELTAKLLAAGGADVCLTYHQGHAEAADIVAEITRHGGKATAVALDVRAPFNAGWRSPQGWLPTHLYYFATPFIFSGQRSGFSAELLARLSAYYLTGFAQLVGPLAASSLSAAFYPSTVALDELPTDMAEYCAAKAAGETLCQLLARRHRGLRIDYPRLPRVATDQTASLLPVGNQDPLPVMRDLLLTFAAGAPEHIPGVPTGS